MEKCKRCNKRIDYLDELQNKFQICNSCYNQNMIVFIPSENKIIDDFIRYTLINHERIGKMEFVPYHKFEDVKFVAEGGFSKVYKGMWIDGPIKRWDSYERNGKMTVALKELNNSKTINSKELNEVKLFNILMFCYKY
jgi:hypothetical protein